MTDTLRIEPRLIRWLHCSISLYGLKFESTGYILVADCICLTSSCLALWAAKVANNYVGSRASNLLPIDMTSCYWLILTSALSLSVSGLRFCQLKSRFCDTPLYHSTPSLDLTHENITKHNRGKIYTLCYQLCKTAESYVYLFLPERDYVTFGSLLSQFHLSSVCNVGAHYSWGSSRCPPAIFLHRCVRWPSSDLRAKFYGDRPRGTPPWDALNARGYQNTAILHLSKAISHKRYTIDVCFLLKTNRKSYALYRMVTLPISLRAPNHPKPPRFLHFATPFIFPWHIKLGTSNLVGRFIIACRSLLIANRPGNGRGQGHVTKFRMLHPMKYLWNG